MEVERMELMVGERWIRKAGSDSQFGEFVGTII